MGAPFLTGVVAEKSIELVFVLVAVLALLGSIVLTIVSFRYQKVFHSETNIIDIH